jgi:hypothetical protein
LRQFRKYKWWLLCFSVLVMLSSIALFKLGHLGAAIAALVFVWLIIRISFIPHDMRKGEEIALKIAFVSTWITLFIFSVDLMLFNSMLISIVVICFLGLSLWVALYVTSDK